MMKKNILFILILFLPLFALAQRPVVEVTGSVVTVTSYTNKEVVVNGKTDLHITAESNQLTNSIVKLNSEESWLFFDNVRPKYVIDNLLGNIYINGEAATYRTNCRVSI